MSPSLAHQLIGCLCLVIQVLGVPNPCTSQHSRPHLPQVLVWAFLLSELNPQCTAGSESLSVPFCVLCHQDTNGVVMLTVWITSNRALQTPVKSVSGTHVFRLVSKLINFKPCTGFCWCYLNCAEKKQKKKLHRNEYQPKFSSFIKYNTRHVQNNLSSSW